MDPEEIQNKLLKEKEEIETVLESLSQEFIESIKEPVSAADEIADKYEAKQEFHLEQEALVERLNKINKALEKIKNNTYGICEKCQKQIEITRLKIDPATNLCRECAFKAVE